MSELSARVSGLRSPPPSVCFTAGFFSAIAPESAFLMNKSVAFPTRAFQPEWNTRPQTYTIQLQHAPNPTMTLGTSSTRRPKAVIFLRPSSPIYLKYTCRHHSLNAIFFSLFHFFKKNVWVFNKVYCAKNRQWWI